MDTAAGEEKLSEDELERDRAILEAFSKLAKVEELSKLRRAVRRFYGQILHANRKKGWSYAKIALEVLVPNGVMIRPKTLNRYMMLERQERKSARSTVEKVAKKAKPPESAPTLTLVPPLEPKSPVPSKFTTVRDRRGRTDKA